MIWELLAILANADAYEISIDAQRELVIRELHDDTIESSAADLEDATDTGLGVIRMRDSHAIA